MGLLDRFRLDRIKDANALITEGNALEDSGHFDEALKRYDAALVVTPSLARAHLNRGNALLELGDPTGALAAYAAALQHEPAYAPAYCNRGNVYLRIGELESALSEYEHSLELVPSFSAAEYGRSNVLVQLGRIDDAIVSYRRVISLDPNNAASYFSLGELLRKRNALDEAVTCIQRAAELEPQVVEIHSALGSVLQDLGRLHEAAESYRRVLALRPDFLEVLGNLGNVHRDLGQFDAAASCYRHVLKLQPDSAEALSNLGTVLQEQGRLDEALASYRHALSINPALAMAHNNSGTALKDLGNLVGAEQSFRSALQVQPDYPEALSNLLFLHNYRADVDERVAFNDARKYGAIVAQQAKRYEKWSSSGDPEKRLRVGFVSGDLRIHPVGYFFENVAAALRTEHRDTIELFAYATHFRNDELTDRIKSYCEGWYCAVGRSDESFARKIESDAIDILIDLSGHTAHNRLPVFAWKPAPIQMTWLGYFATTGVSAIDYLIADPWTLPPSEERNFTERILRLPETRLCFTPPRMNVDVAPAPASTGKPITFGCFNNLAKVTDDVIATWGRLLTALPESRLMLMARQLGHGPTRSNVAARFAANGVNEDRLILQSRLPRVEYLRSYGRVDIALDTFPYTGGTTTVEALWMGVPVLTVEGRSFVERQGVGLLKNVGLDDWIAADTKDYVTRATFLAANTNQLNKLRFELRGRLLNSPLMDAPRFASQFEAVLRRVWREWCTSKPAARSAKADGFRHSTDGY